ncbi:hypothetical protein RRG08_011237 [Elysia crispata]|uniref:Uncharacterized protein n=1 Tax=Elysia crispata TaxID=231223 RepID=A0AAE0YNE9_9GAST|nr:hypothetical protein RRG08_011237 [Elysia crispata]
MFSTSEKTSDTQHVFKPCVTEFYPTCFQLVRKRVIPNMFSTSEKTSDTQHVFKQCVTEFYPACFQAMCNRVLPGVFSSKVMPDTFQRPALSV